MHVLQVLKFSPRFGGGIVDHLSALGESLVSRGDRITYAFPLRRPWFDELGQWGDVLELPEIDRPLPWTFGKRLRRIIRAKNVNVLHVHFAFGLAMSLAIAPKPIGVPTVYHWHNPPRLLLPNRHGIGIRVGRHVGRAAARFGDRRLITRHLTVSRDVGRILVEKHWTQSQKVIVCPNAIRVPALAQGSRGGRIEDPVIGSVANFRPQKDHATLLRGFQMFARTRPRARLCLIGDGPTRSEMQDLAGSLGIAGQVDFLGTRTDPEGIYRPMDIFVLCSRYEGHPLVVLEAMSHAKPVVATDLPSVREVLQGRLGEFLVPPKNAEAVSRDLVLLSEQGGLRKSLGRLGRARVENDYRMETWVNSVLGAYQAALVCK